MKSIRDRFEELNIIKNDEYGTTHLKYEARLEIIQKEFFNDTINIRCENFIYVWNNGHNYYDGFMFFINNDRYEDKEDFIDKLQQLYDLQQIKKKIDNINDND